jgi:hypothetical protein
LQPHFLLNDLTGALKRLDNLEIDALLAAVMLGVLSDLNRSLDARRNKRFPII